MYLVQSANIFRRYNEEVFSSYLVCGDFGKPHRWCKLNCVVQDSFRCSILVETEPF